MREHATCVQGNCAVSDPVEALELTPDVAADLLPLKPRQCLVVVSQTWLMINSGNLWVDNVYLKLSRRLARPNFAFVTAGALNAEYTWPNIVRSTTFLTGITFHGEHRGNARGIIADITAAAVAVDGAQTHILQTSIWNIPALQTPLISAVVSHACVATIERLPPVIESVLPSTT